MLSSSVGMGYTGRIIALLTVCEGSRQILTLAGFVADPGRSRTTILEIQGVGLSARVYKFVQGFFDDG